MQATYLAGLCDSITEQTFLQQAVNAYNNSSSVRKVGAAFLAKASVDSYVIFNGANIDGPYPSMKLCAEGGALSAGAAKGYKTFIALAIASSDGKEGLCKICNPILYYTLQQKELTVLFIDKAGKVVSREGGPSKT